MAGHSKWANIKHKKARADAKKGKIFSRFAKEIISAAKMGGPDPDGNPRLRMVIQKAKANSVPNEIITRNIKKSTDKDQGDFVEMTYDIYGEGGVGIIVEGMTDNNNRMFSSMQTAVKKNCGKVGTQGSVSFNFKKQGVIKLKLGEAMDGDTLFLEATDAGAEDLKEEEDQYFIYTKPEELNSVKEGLAKSDISIEQDQIEWLPEELKEVDDETYEKNMQLIEFLEELDDVDAVYHNMAPKE